ncbi:unnamed protein product [Nippostrongylus brasiliensis]|uniref:Uncharacterized protein n=1 Tax=Nippostrongylus brasiliensis TaxID=27835 RepID=A0A0N4Y3P1_NIPBR|nr:unnamed protein product [Nippostrongylus brasiliensis]
MILRILDVLELHFLSRPPSWPYMATFMAKLNGPGNPFGNDRLYDTEQTNNAPLSHSLAVKLQNRSSLI